MRAIYIIGKRIAAGSWLSKAARHAFTWLALSLCALTSAATSPASPSSTAPAQPSPATARASLSASSTAEKQIRIDSVEVELLFPIAKSHINLAFRDNAAQMKRIIALISSIQNDPAQRLSRIHIVGYASPDGNYDFNQRLSRSRADNLAKYLQTQFPLPDSIFSHQYAGIDWEGLDHAVGESQLRDRHKVQYIIRHEPELTRDAKGTIVRSRKQQLMNLDGGRTWGWLMQNIYPKLRRSTSVICYIEQLPQPETIEEETIETPDTVQDIVADTVSGTEDLTVAPDTVAIAPLLPPYQRYPIAALRSNLLVPLLNVGIEVPVSKHWSVGADYYYPWIWPAKSNKNCFELIFVSAEARYWFNPNTNPQLPDKNYLSGHSVGLYGAWGYYDIERNWHGHQGHAWSMGLDYVFSLPIAKDRLRLEFQLAAGVVWSPKAKPYNVYEYGGHLIRERGTHKNFSYFGPTKVGISLVVPLCRKVKTQIPAEP